MTGPAEVMLAPARLPGRLAFSPDGTLLAAGAAVIDVGSGRVLRVFRGQLSPVTGAAFSPDGALLATASFDGNVRVWGTVDGSVRADIAVGPDDWASDVAFSPDGTVLAAACDDSETVRLWDPRTGRALATFTIGADATCVDFAPDGRLLAVGSWSDTVDLWDVAAGIVTGALEGHESAVKDVAFSPDGRLLATACLDGKTRIWDVAGGTVRATLAGSDEGVTAVAFAPDGGLLATASEDDGTVRVWDAGRWALRRALTHPGHEAAIAAAGMRPWGAVAAVSPNGRLLATLPDGPESGTVRVWDIATGTPGAVIAAADSWADPGDEYELRIPETAFSPDGSLLATTSMMGRAFLWEAATGAPRATLAGHDRGWAVTAIAFASDGTLVATGSMDWTARIWDPRDGTLRTTLTCDEAVYSVAFSPEGTLLATVSADRSVWVWDLATATVRTVIRSPDFVSATAFLPGGRYLATVTDTGTARIWDTGTGPVTTVPAVTLVALAGDGYAALLPDGGYKLSGDAGDRLWWLDGLRRLAPDELGASRDGPRRLPAGARLL